MTQTMPSYGRFLPRLAPGEHFEVIDDLNVRRSHKRTYALAAMVAVLFALVGAMLYSYADVPAPSNPANNESTMPNPPSFY